MRFLILIAISALIGILLGYYGFDVMEHKAVTAIVGIPTSIFLVFVINPWGN